ncbi:MAG: hypothetical protein AB1442_01040 [Nitrospirota bacterium]
MPANPSHVLMEGIQRGRKNWIPACAGMTKKDPTTKRRISR